MLRSNAWQWRAVLDTFSPREIQARVRAGASAEIVAAETGWPLDKVIRYAEPLLAERSYIAEQARAVEVRRTGAPMTLAATAGAALGVDPESASIGWDAYRRDDGKWIVVARYTESGSARVAEWTYDHTGRNIHPLNDDARALMGVRREEDDDIAALTEALDLIADRAEPVETETRPRLVAVPDADDREDIDEDELDVDDSAALADTSADAPAPVSHSEPTISLPVDPPARPAAKPAAKKATKSRRGRASVPSWDEILFGATRTDD